MNDEERELIQHARTMRESIETMPKPGSILGLWLRTAAALEARIESEAKP